MSTHNIGFYEDLTKIIFQLSSNTHLISSPEMSHVSSLVMRKPAFGLLTRFLTRSNTNCMATEDD